MTRHNGDSGSADDADAFLRAVAASPSRTPEAEPSRVAHFRIAGRLGEGGMGVVYRAEDERLRRTVALKLLPDPSSSEEKRQRFLREARSAAALTHPNVAVVHEVGEAEGRVYIAMELVEGESLRTRLDRGRLDVATARELAGQIARGLSAAHEKGIVHRDLKPENVMITPAGAVKLLDFGLAKGAERPASEDGELPLARTETLVTSDEGRLMGTPQYMSPEQALGAPLDVRSDVFSLGIVLYEMLSGSRPFAGSSAGAVLVAIARDAVPSLRERAPQVDVATEAVVMRCLAKAPAERFADAGEVATALSGQTSPKATTVSRVEIRTQATRGPSRPARSGRRAGGLAAAVGLALALSLLAWRYTAHGRKPSAAAAVPSGSAAAAAPTVIKPMDLPPPVSSSAEAVAAYLDGVKAEHDGMNTGYQDLQRAVSLDPTLAAADLRLTEAFVADSEMGMARAAYRSMLGHIDRLSARDRAIASALEPAVLTDPPDWAESTRRLQSLHDAAPGDLDLLMLVGSTAELGGMGQRAEASFEAVTRMDPSFGNAWSALAGYRKGADARALMERCLRESPRATQCLARLFLQDQAEGNCSAALAWGRRIIAVSPDDSWGYWYVASALAALGESVDTVEEALREEASHIVVERESVVLSQRERLAAFTGDFARAAQLMDEVAKAETHGPSVLTGPDFSARWSVEIARERGDLGASGRIAQDYLRRQHAYAAPELANDPTPYFLDAARRAGAISPKVMSAQMDTWRRNWRERLEGALPDSMWVMADAAVVETKEEALAAIAVRPPLESLVAEGTRVAHVSLLAERYAEAEPLLAAAARSCNVLGSPFDAVRSHYELGLAREGLGDRDGACAAYRGVIARWGAAKPRSVTADKTRARMAALACDR